VLIKDEMFEQHFLDFEQIKMNLKCFLYSFLAILLLIQFFLSLLQISSVKDLIVVALQ